MELSQLAVAFAVSLATVVGFCAGLALQARLLRRARATDVAPAAERPTTPATAFEMAFVLALEAKRAGDREGAQEHFGRCVELLTQMFELLNLSPTGGGVASGSVAAEAGATPGASEAAERVEGPPRRQAKNRVH